MSYTLQDAIIIIRSSNERTENLCKKLILEQGIHNSEIFVIHEIPFSQSLLKSFEIGIESGKKWTFCVDADVLLRPNSIDKMIRHANSQSQNVCQVQGYMLDKFFGGVRKGGVHLYRTALLNKVIDKVPVEGTDIRPESFTLRLMEDEGYPSRVVPYVVGLHDFEQYYFDIYRKAFVQVEKHLSRAELLITIWKQFAEQDHDYCVALKGFADSLTNDRDVFINSELPLYTELFDNSGIKEKSELDINSYDDAKIEKIITEWNCLDIYHSYFPDKDGYELALSSFFKKVKRAFTYHGLFTTTRLSISKLFYLISRKLR
ncbi:MAG: hypothetical protein JJU37_17070 [Balneolaceae bacterium]|nr:hypothetical protein [Balneolaceae bacterium]